MKRLLSVIGMLLMIFALAGCGSKAPTQLPDNPSSQEEAAPLAETEAAESAVSESESQTESAPAKLHLSFNTVDLSGNTVTEADFADVKLILVNFWEPWCGPCVMEMPELETLYQNYKEEGLLILGAFATPEMDEDAQAVLDDNGITYPIVKMDASLGRFTTDYVPTSFFVDGNWDLISTQPIVGAKDYDGWEALVKDYLEE